LKNKERNFIGKEAFELKKKTGDHHLLKGLLFEDRCIVRSNQEIFFDEQKTQKGIVTSGTYSPTLKKSIALARIAPSDREKCLAEVRGKIFTAAIGQPRFVKEGKIVF
jgi:aminomethyltransferase